VADRYIQYSEWKGSGPINITERNEIFFQNSTVMVCGPVHGLISRPLKINSRFFQHSELEKS